MQQTVTFNQLFEQIKQLSPYEQFQLAQKVLATLFQQAQFFTETDATPPMSMEKLNLPEQDHLEQQYPKTRNGFLLFPHRSDTQPVTMELVNELREETI